MKIHGLLIGMFMVLALTAGMEKSYALENEVQPKTCSGQYAVFGAQGFFFGYTDEKGNCGVQSFYANSYGEAYSCAQEKCTECRIQDLTNLYQFGSAQPGYNPGEEFCPKK